MPPEEIARTGGYAESMTLRDHFAAAALTGLLAAEIDTADTFEQSARTAYKQADAMLAARNAKPLPPRPPIDPDAAALEAR